MVKKALSEIGKENRRIEKAMSQEYLLSKALRDDGGSKMKNRGILRERHRPLFRSGPNGGWIPASVQYKIGRWIRSKIEGVLLALFSLKR